MIDDVHPFLGLKCESVKQQFANDQTSIFSFYFALTASVYSMNKCLSSSIYSLS